MSESVLESIRQRIETADRVLVASHIRPDGDAVGSLLALGLALEAAGKQVQMVLMDKVPHAFKHLEGAGRVKSKAGSPYDLSIVVDCSDLERTGGALVSHSDGKAVSEPVIPDINIDHHISNPGFAQINLVEPEAAATAEVLARYLPSIGLEITQPVASALLTGILTDTLGFRTSNVTPDVLRTAAWLMEKGADLHELYRYGLVQRTFEAACFWGQGLTRLERDDSMVWTTLTLQDRKEASYPGRDDADLINILSSIEDADIALIFVEQGKGVKVSWRAQPGFDVSRVAQQFGGGGHRAAAGAQIEGSMPDIREKVLAATRMSLHAQLEQNRKAPVNRKDFAGDKI